MRTLSQIWKIESWINSPAHRKSKALNKAWVNKRKKVILKTNQNGQKLKTTWRIYNWHQQKTFSERHANALSMSTKKSIQILADTFNQYGLKKIIIGLKKLHTTHHQRTMLKKHFIRCSKEITQNAKKYLLRCQGSPEKYSWNHITEICHRWKKFQFRSRNLVEWLAW